MSTTSLDFSKHKGYSLKLSCNWKTKPVECSPFGLLWKKLPMQAKRAYNSTAADTSAIGEDTRKVDQSVSLLTWLW